MENNQNNTPQEYNGVNKSSQNLPGITKAGLIVSIVFSSIGIFYSLIMTIASLHINNHSNLNDGVVKTVNYVMVVIWLIILAGEIVTIIFCAKALKQKTKNLIIVAGVLGLIFSWIVGGILTLCGLSQIKSDNQNEQNEPQNLK